MEPAEAVDWTISHTQ